ncbi:hypothetical protein Mh1949_14570 [Mannheimia haemolytica]|nr:hypothetical protein MHA_1993 [Mannheimia haemolytica PHL213]
MCKFTIPLNYFLINRRNKMAEKQLSFKVAEIVPMSAINTMRHLISLALQANYEREKSRA